MIVSLLLKERFDIPGWLLGSVVMVSSFIVSLPLAALCARPLAPVFVVHQAKKRKDYIGTVCTVSTGEVSAKLGHARIQEGGYVLEITVRTDSEHVFSRHEKALIIDYDDARGAYIIEPVADLLTGQDSNK